MKLQLNLIKVFETLDDLYSLSPMQRDQLTESLKQYFGQTVVDLNYLFDQPNCVAICIQVVDAQSPDKVIFDFWEVNFDSGSLFFPNSLEPVGINKIQNSFNLADNLHNPDLEEFAAKLNLAKKVKIAEPIGILFNERNEIIEFKQDKDIPKNKRSWITFLRKHPLSEELIKKHRTHFDQAAWKEILNKSHLSDSFLESLAPDIGWKLVSEYQYLSEAFIQKYEQLLDWKVISFKQKLSEKQIIHYKDKLDWTAISWAQPLSPELIAQFSEKLNWESLCMYQKLDLDTIKNNVERLNKNAWQNISQKQPLSDDLLMAWPDHIDWKFASMNIHLTDTQLLEFKDKIVWSRLINYGRKLGFEQIKKLIKEDAITYNDIEDIVNERAKFELTDDQVTELKKTVKQLKKQKPIDTVK